MNTDILLFLSCLPRVGKATLRKVVKSDMVIHSIDFTAIIERFSALHQLDGKIPVPSMDDLNVAEHKWSTLLRENEKNHISVISVLDHHFPSRTRAIPESPILLFVKGNRDALSRARSVAIIGTREVSPKGFRAGERLGRVFAEKGFVVISGLAKGSDTAGHLGSTAARGESVAVLAGGLDKVYPKENTKLSEAILECGGALVSEYPVGTSPQKGYFVERDRLQSGLSDAVIVIETSLTGGTMHTVRFCKEHGRILACLDPARIGLNPSTMIEGNQYILSSLGGIPIGDANDIDRVVRCIHLG